MSCIPGGHARDWSVFGLVYLASFSRCFIYPYAGMLGMPCFIAPYQKLASYLFLSATRTIAQAWKSPFVPFQGVWDRMTNMMLNEQMSSMCNDSQCKFSKIWEPWLQYAFPTLPLASMGM
ncbi:unnamed protein product [Staurois parvus]|uniref:Uncharacterized protein n=1 Tax=Staurois parvus TaxID=386267 RepID=A0ABN9GNU6_9NEOB|nr:unnamed protein product [Staurois parvus]